MSASTNRRNGNTFGIITAAIAGVVLASGASGFDRVELRPVKAEVHPAKALVAQTPDERPESRTDWNLDKVTDIRDLLSYLDDYFAGAPKADIIGSDGRVNGLDLVTYLDWFMDPALQDG